MRKQRPVLSFYLYLRYVLLIFLSIYLAFLETIIKPFRSGDGPEQLYPALYYYGDWLKNLFGNLIHGTLPMWSWDIGLGSDVITTLGYYVVGDPLLC